MKLFKLAPICGVLLAAVVACGCSKLKARDQLNKGVTAFRNAQFQQAIKHFQNAVQLDPGLLNARLYLATAYFQLYVPGGDSKDNVDIAKQAITAYEDVLRVDPNNSNAIATIAQIYFYLKDFDKAKEYQRRMIQLEPQNADAYYWIGVIDWAVCYPNTMQVRKDLNIILPKDPKKPDILPPIPDKARADLADKNGPLVDEGIQALGKAIEIRPNDAHAMTYLNLMYRQKAEIEADPAARDSDLDKANNLMQKALGIEKGETEKGSATAQ